MFCKKSLLMALLSLLLLAGQSITAKAQVYVNGEYIQGEDLVLLERLAGGPIPAGNYWLNYYTGEWGYAGNPIVQGIIGGGNNYQNGSYGNAGNGSGRYNLDVGGGVCYSGTCENTGYGTTINYDDAGGITEY